MPRNLEKPITPVIVRMMQALRAGSLRELAEKMDVPENTVRTWHKRDAVPKARVEQAANLSTRPYEWFIKGESLFLRKDANELAGRVGDDASGQAHKVTENGPTGYINPTGATGAQSGKVQQGVAADAGRPMDRQTMRYVIEAVAQQLQDRHLWLPPPKLAELVMLIYDHLADEAPEAKQVERATERFLRLVA